MFIRFNTTTNIYEYDTSAGQTGAGPWLILPNVPFLDRSNQFIKEQIVIAPDPAYRITQTTQPLDKKVFRMLNFGQNFYIQATDDAVLNSLGIVNITRDARIGANSYLVKGPIQSDPHELDYYEEGLWTPRFVGESGTVSGQAYSTQIGIYTRIGNKIHVEFGLAISNVGVGGSGNLYIIDLPFINNGLLQGMCTVIYYSGLVGAVTNITGLVLTNNNAASLYYKNTASAGIDGILTYGNIQAGTVMIGSMDYFAP